MLHHPMILQCPLFQGLPPDALDYALSYFEAHVKAYEKGDFLHQVSFPLERFAWCCPAPSRSPWTTWMATISS